MYGDWTEHVAIFYLQNLFQSCSLSNIIFSIFEDILYPDMKKKKNSSQILLKLTFSDSVQSIFIVLGPDTSTPGSRDGKHRGDKGSSGGRGLTVCCGQWCN
jgi:hypothetical protein